MTQKLFYARASTATSRKPSLLSVLLNYAASAAEESKSFISLALGDRKWIIGYSVLWYTITMREQSRCESIHMFFYLNTRHWVKSPEKMWLPGNQGNGPSTRLHSAVSHFCVCSFSGVKWKGYLVWRHIHTHLHVIYNYKKCVRIHIHIFIQTHVSIWMEITRVEVFGFFLNFKFKSLTK